MKKVSYLNSNKELFSIDFDLVITNEVGAYFYSENVYSVFKDLVLFLPIKKPFTIEIKKQCQCLVQPK